MKFEVQLTRLEFYTVWGEIEADSEEEALKQANLGNYQETFRKYRDTSFQEVDEIMLMESE